MLDIRLANVFVPDHSDCSYGHTLSRSSNQQYFN